MTSASIGAETHLAVRRARLPRFAPLLVVVIAAAAATLIGLSVGFSLVGIAVLAGAFYLVALPAWSAVVENRRSAVDRLVTSAVWCSLVIALAPLLSILWMVLSNGVSQLTWSFFVDNGVQTLSPTTFKPVGGDGIAHAIVGTLIITAAAAVISIPIGVLAAIYLVEYGQKSRPASVLRFLVDVMTGIPSIVAGLFAYALFALLFGPSVKMALGGSIALSLLMIPIVVRSSEEMLKLVPEHLREASYALGVPKWRTILKVVLPTASAGIITGITLAIARVIGETAPLLIVAGSSAATNYNLFGKTTPTETLPVFIFNTYNDQTGKNASVHVAHAWGAALVLIIVVLALNLLARVLGRMLAPSKSH